MLLLLYRTHSPCPLKFEQTKGVNLPSSSHRQIKISLFHPLTHRKMKHLVLPSVQAQLSTFLVSQATPRLAFAVQPV